MLNPSVLSIAKNFIKNSSETIEIAIECLKLKPRGGKSKRFCVLSKYCLYLIKEKEDCNVLSKMINFIDIERISLIHENCIVFNENGNANAYETEFAPDLGKVFMSLCNSFHDQKNKNCIIIESNHLELFQNRLIVERDPMTLFDRLLVLELYYDTNISKDILEYLENWSFPSSSCVVLNQKNLNKNEEKAIAHAISIDRYVQAVELDGFASSCLHNFLYVYFKYTLRSIDFSFSNYDSVQIDDINSFGDFKLTVNSVKMSTINSSSVLYILKLLNGVSIRKLNMNNCTVKSTDLYDIFILLNNTLSLELISVVFEGISEFIVQLTEYSLRSIIISNVQTDISWLIPSVLSIRTLYFLNVNNSSIMKSAYIPCPGSDVAGLVFKDCDMETSSLFSIIISFIKLPRIVPLSICISGIKGDKKCRQYISDLTKVKTYPNIIEFCWKNNQIDGDDVDTLIKFLSNQKNLNYLSLRGCIRKDAMKILPQLADFIINSSIQGIDVSTDKQRGMSREYARFILQLKNLSCIRSISFRNVKLDPEGIDSLISLVESLPNLNEISLDNIGFPDINSFTNFYQKVFNLPKSLYVKEPKKDLNRFNASSESWQVSTTKVISMIKSKNPPRTMHQRHDRNRNVKLNHVADPISKYIQTGEKNGDINPLDELETILAMMVVPFDNKRFDSYMAASTIMENLEPVDPFNKKRQDKAPLLLKVWKC